MFNSTQKHCLRLEVQRDALQAQNMKQQEQIAELQINLEDTERRRMESATLAEIRLLDGAIAEESRAVEAATHEEREAALDSVIENLRHDSSVNKADALAKQEATLKATHATQVEQLAADLREQEASFEEEHATIVDRLKTEHTHELEATKDMMRALEKQLADENHAHAAYLKMLKSIAEERRTLRSSLSVQVQAFADLSKRENELKATCEKERRHTTDLATTVAEERRLANEKRIAQETELRSVRVAHEMLKATCEKERRPTTDLAGTVAEERRLANEKRIAQETELRVAHEMLKVT